MTDLEHKVYLDFMLSNLIRQKIANYKTFKVYNNHTFLSLLSLSLKCDIVKVQFPEVCFKVNRKTFE